MFRNLTEDATIEIYFETFASTGAPVAPSSAFTTSDFAIYKNGSATAKSTTNGLTVTSPFNSETGCHLLVIDTSNDTGDSGFWTTGARYQVKFNTAKTVGSQSIDGVSVPRGSFGIQSEYMRGTDSAALASGVTVTSIGANVITANAIADGAIDTATFASGTTLPRVTLVDTCSVNSDMRGTDNAALAATALSTAVWTATIAGRIDVALSTLATAANQTKTLDRLGYLMAQEIGACADAGTSAESYTLTIDTTTYTIDHTGLDATGNRGTATLTKS